MKVTVQLPKHLIHFETLVQCVLNDDENRNWFKHATQCGQCHTVHAPSTPHYNRTHKPHTNLIALCLERHSQSVLLHHGRQPLVHCEELVALHVQQLHSQRGDRHQLNQVNNMVSHTRTHLVVYGTIAAEIMITCKAQTSHEVGSKLAEVRMKFVQSWPKLCTKWPRTSYEVGSY